MFKVILSLHTQKFMYMHIYTYMHLYTRTEGWGEIAS